MNDSRSGRGGDTFVARPDEDGIPRDLRKPATQISSATLLPDLDKQGPGLGNLRHAAKVSVIALLVIGVFPVAMVAGYLLDLNEAAKRSPSPTLVAAAGADPAITHPDLLLPAIQEPAEEPVRDTPPTAASADLPLGARTVPAVTPADAPSATPDVQRPIPVPEQTSAPVVETVVMPALPDVPVISDPAATVARAAQDVAAPPPEQAVETTISLPPASLVPDPQATIFAIAEAEGAAAVDAVVGGSIEAAQAPVIAAAAMPELPTLPDVPPPRIDSGPMVAVAPVPETPDVQATLHSAAIDDLPRAQGGSSSAQGGVEVAIAGGAVPPLPVIPAPVIVPDATKAAPRLPASPPAVDDKVAEQRLAAIARELPAAATPGFPERGITETSRPRPGVRVEGDAATRRVPVSPPLPPPRPATLQAAVQAPVAGEPLSGMTDESALLDEAPGGSAQRVFIHVSSSSPLARLHASRLVEALSMHRIEVAGIRSVDFPIRSSSVRFFHDEDQPIVPVLQDVMAAVEDGEEPMSRDFRRYRSPPRPGTLEIWLAD